MTLLLQSAFGPADRTSHGQCAHAHTTMWAQKYRPAAQNVRYDVRASFRPLRRQSGSSWRSTTMKLGQTATEPPVPLHPAELQPNAQPDRGRSRARAASEAHRTIGRALASLSARIASRFFVLQVAISIADLSVSFRGVSEVLRGTYCGSNTAPSYSISKMG